MPEFFWLNAAFKIQALHSCVKCSLILSPVRDCCDRSAEIPSRYDVWTCDCAAAMHPSRLKMIMWLSFGISHYRGHNLYFPGKSGQNSTRQKVDDKKTVACPKEKDTPLCNTLRIQNNFVHVCKPGAEATGQTFWMTIVAEALASLTAPPLRLQV